MQRIDVIEDYQHSQKIEQKTNLVSFFRKERDERRKLLDLLLGGPDPEDPKFPSSRRSPHELEVEQSALKHANYGH